MKAIRVLLVDDHTLTRAGLRLLVEKIQGASVLGEAGNGRDAIAMAEKLKPDIVLMDISMPELNGIDATARIAKSLPSVKVIILSTYSDEDHVLHALHAGAAGYLLKNSAITEFHLAIRAVANGSTFLSPAIAKYVINKSFGKTPDVEGGMLDPLTPRQRETLQLLAEGKSTKEAAFLMNVSVKTAETHRAQIMDRLDIHDIPGLVRFAIRAGVIVP